MRKRTVGGNPLVQVNISAVLYLRYYCLKRQVWLRKSNWEVLARRRDQCKVVFPVLVKREISRKLFWFSHKAVCAPKQTISLQVPNKDCLRH